MGLAMALVLGVCVGHATALAAGDAQADKAAAIRAKLDRAFSTYVPNIGEGNNCQKLKMAVLFRRRKGVSTAPYLEALVKEIDKAGPDTARGLHLRSALSFGYVAALERDTAKGVQMHITLLKMDKWPPGTEALREEVTRDFLRFLSIKEPFREYYTDYQRLTPGLLAAYIAPENKSPTLLPFGAAVKGQAYAKSCHNVVRRERMRLKGHILSLKKAGYFCGEIGEYDDCERLLRWALDVCPDDGQRQAILDRLSAFMARGKRHAAALTYYRQAHRDDADVAVRLHLASLCAAAGRRDEADAIVAAIAKGQPDATTLYRLGQHLVRSRQYESAIAALERYPLDFGRDAARYNESVRAAYNLAVAYSRTGNLQQQQSILERVAANPPKAQGAEALWHTVCEGMLDSLRARRPRRPATVAPGTRHGADN